jgi:hypothetical protein
MVCRSPRLAEDLLGPTTAEGAHMGNVVGPTGAKRHLPRRQVTKTGAGKKGQRETSLGTRASKLGGNQSYGWPIPKHCRADEVVGVGKPEPRLPRLLIKREYG